MRPFPRLTLPLALLTLCLGLPRPATAGELYVGANYHPHDSDPVTWAHDIALMKAGGIRVVRMGHLAWDSYEPRDGQFKFGWFDQCMDMMHAAGIKVILDIAVRPAPLWLHHEHPSVDVADVDGVRQYPNHRYMEDVGDPTYQKYALRFARAMASHYAHHPALLAFGIDNESGDGPISYSAAVRTRFIAWLRAKYGNTDALNRAWAGQRWSRRIGDFDEVGLPVSAGGVMGPPERILDFRRFISDEVSGFLVKLVATVRAAAPGVLTTSNMWYFSPMKYFDYAPLAYAGLLDRGGDGFYPGDSLRQNAGLDAALFGIARVQFENTTSVWCTEFVSGTTAPGAMRKAAYASLMLGNQLACCWTFRTMNAGEEQFLQGLVDWDGQPNRKFQEYKQIAAEFAKIAPYGFPYRPHAEVAIAFSFPSQIASAAFPEPHDGQCQTVFSWFLHRNVDTRIVDLRLSKLPYRLLIVPGMAIMDEPSAAKIRAFVHAGGTVLMTSYSAMLDEHNQVFSTTLPGRLSDVFGIRVGGFEETESMNDVSRDGSTGNHLNVVWRGRPIAVDSPRYDVITPRGADVVGKIVSLDKDYPIVTANRYGRGTAIYVGVPARPEILGPILDDVIHHLAIDTGPRVPPGVMARQIDARHILYLNLDGEPKEVPLAGRAHSILLNRDYRDHFVLNAYAPDFIATEQPPRR